ncbi:MAG: hypothetical protein IT210_16315 [Armatimonadetes bacterium]|nr:hypothetical protein [Armatimonadota bacterium]
MKRIRSRAGVTLAEALVTVGVMSLLTISGMTLLVSASSHGIKGFEQTAADSDMNLAMQKVAMALRQSMGVAVDGNGLGITYYLPLRDVDGNYLLPLAADAGHRLYLSNGDLIGTDWGRPVLKDVPTADPETGSTYRIFTLENAVAGVQVVAVKLTVRRNLGSSCANARLKERVLIRNFLP